VPNLPEFRGELPFVLCPLKLRHYWLLAYWVYFRPTAFHCYLNSAAPDVYQLRGYRKFLQTWRIPAYRNLYLMLPIALALTALLVGLTVFIYTASAAHHNTAWVNAIAVTPNGQIAVTASGDRSLKIKVPAADSTLKVWNLRWGYQMHALTGHEFGITSVAITPDGKRAVSASRDHNLKLWDIRRGAQIHNLTGHKEWVSSVVITPDGQRAISASADKTLKIWDLNQGKELYTLTGHTDTVLAVALTPDGEKLVSASADKTLKVWDLEQGKELYTLKGHRGWVTGLALTIDGEKVISSSGDKTLKVWDLNQGKELYTLTGHSGWVTGVSLSSDGKQAVSASTDQTLIVWDIAQGKALRTLTGHNGWVTNVAITPDGKQAISASADQTLKVWNLQAGKLVHTLTGHQAWVTALTVVPKTAQILSGSFDGYPKLWNLNSGTQVPMLGMLGKEVGLNVGLTLGLTLSTICVSLTVALILAIGVMTFGVAGSIFACIALLLVGSLIFSFVFLVIDRIAADPMLNAVYNAVAMRNAIIIVFGIALGLLVNITFGISSRKALGVFASVVFILVIGIAAGIIVACVVTSSISFKGRLLPGIRAFQAVGIYFNLLVAIGALRLPFYPIELVMALLGRFRGKLHPVTWDELLVLPLPGTKALLQSHLRALEKERLQLARDLVSNPFQRAAVQQALHTNLHSQTAPLYFLYHLLKSHDLNTYIVEPVSKLDWQLLPTTKQVLLGEFANQQVDCSSDGFNQIAENLVGVLTWFGRNRKATPLTRFASMLYEFAYTKVVEKADFNLYDYEKNYTGVTEYPGGKEIVESFENLAIFLSYKNLSDVSFAGDLVSKLVAEETSLRRELLTAMTKLGEIGDAVKDYQETLTRIEKQAALARLTSTLDALDEYVVEQVFVPEQAILRRIIHQWRRLVSKAVVELDQK